MDIHVQAEKAERLRKLHHGPHILVLPNSWDVASARLMEEAGYPAIDHERGGRGISWVSGCAAHLAGGDA